MGVGVACGRGAGNVDGDLVKASDTDRHTHHTVRPPSLLITLENFVFLLFMTLPDLCKFGSIEAKIRSILLPWR